MSESRFPTGDRQLDEILAEYLRAVETGDSPNTEQLIAQHPAFADQLGEFFADKHQIDEFARRDQNKTPADPLAPTLPATPKVQSDGLADFEQNESLVDESIRCFGDYELLEEIARGGMGVVYKARQVSLNRPVALKMILAGQLASEDDIKRFHTEAEAAANLDHRRIVPIYEIGEHKGQHYFSMGFVEGESLAAKIKEGPIPPKAAAGYVKKIAEAVAYAHTKGVVHRDLKPGNVLIDENDEPKVTDFGLAKRVEGDSDLTATGQILGTPSFMPPEQASGKATEITKSADVYSLGAVLYALITGRPPFQADNPVDTLMQVLEREPISPKQLNSKVPEDLETICLKCLEKDQRNRYASVQELAEDVRRFLNHEPITARPIGVHVRSWRWCRRNPWQSVAGATLALLLLVAFVASIRLKVAADRLETERDISQDRLWQSLVEQARSERLSGNREQSIRTLTEAADIKRNARLRQEAIQTLTTPGIRFRYELHFGDVRKLGASSDLMAASGYYDLPGSDSSHRSSVQGIRVWNIRSGKLLEEVPLRDSRKAEAIRNKITMMTGSPPVNLPDRIDGIPNGPYLAFSPDKCFVARWVPTRPNDDTNEVQDGVIQIWDLKNPRLKQTLSGLTRPKVVFSPDGSLVAVHGKDGSKGVVKIWEVDTGAVVGTIPENACPVWGDGGRLLATIGPGMGSMGRWAVEHGIGDIHFNTQFVNVWEVARTVPTYKFSDHVQWLSFSPDGDRMAVNNTIWDVVKGRHQQWLRQSTVEIKGRFAALCQGDTIWVAGSRKFWSDETPNTLWQLTPEKREIVLTEPDEYPAIYQKRVSSQFQFEDVKTSEAFTDEGKLKPGIRKLSAAFNDDGQLKQKVSIPSAFTFSSDGQRMIMASRIWWVDNTAGTSGSTYLDVWDLAASERLATWGDTSEISCVTFSPDGHRIATGGGSITIRDASGKRLHYIPPDVESRTEQEQSPGEFVTRTSHFQVRCVTFGADSRILFAGFRSTENSLRDGFVKLWDVETGRELGNWKGHRGGVFSLAISPDGRILASGGEDHKICLWDVTSGQELVRWEGHKGSVTALTFAPDGELLVSGSADGIMKLWHIPSIRKQLEVLNLNWDDP